MTFDIITKVDLKNFKDEIINEISTLLQGRTDHKKWLKQNLRVNSTLPFTKMGATYYYEYSDVVKILTENKSA